MNETYRRSIYFFSDETTASKAVESNQIRQILIDWQLEFDETKIGVDFPSADFETPNVMISGLLLKGEELVNFLDYLTTR